MGVAALDMMRPAVLAAAAAAAAEGERRMAESALDLLGSVTCDRDDDEAARKGGQMLGGSEMVTKIDQCCWIETMTVRDQN